MSGGADFLSQIQDFSKQSLKKVETQLTTPDGKQFVERRDDAGASSLEPRGSGGLGFCPDSKPDKTVGVALEGLLVGSQDVAHDYQRLKELGITHILNVGYGIPNAFTNDFTSLTVDMFDDLSQSLTTHYPQCEQFIEQARSAGGTVLIHCNAGISRSSSIALAYVIHKEKIPLAQALKRLRETRPAVQPNEGFMQQLRAMETQLGIKRKKKILLLLVDQSLLSTN